MNAMTLDPSAVGQATLGRPRLLGLRNLVRKDLAEWFHGKRPWLVLGVTTHRLRPRGRQCPDHRMGRPVLPGRSR